MFLYLYDGVYMYTYEWGGKKKQNKNKYSLLSCMTLKMPCPVHTMNKCVVKK